MATWIATAALAATLALPVQPPSVEQIFAVPPDLHARFQQQLATRGTSERERLYAVVDFIFDSDGDGVGLVYDDTQTRTVAQAYTSGKANCLSFTLLFMALARDAGLRPQAQEVAQTLVWREDGNAFYASGHVNAGLRIGGRQWTADLARSLAASPQAPRQISDRRLASHFYNNRGAELMASGQLAAADTFLDAALKMTPELAEALNNRGVLRARTGDTSAAARAYLAALEANPGNSAALSNLVVLYRRSDNPRSADVHLRRLQRLQTQDPFRQYVLATDAERAGRFDEAVRHYRRAIRLYEGAHQFHFGLARTYLLIGKSKAAERELLRAMELGRKDVTVENRYAAKLAGLRRLSKHTATPSDAMSRSVR